MRAGHDPSIAAKHYSGRVSETDRGLATAVASLLSPDPVGTDNVIDVPPSSGAGRRLA